MMDIETFHNLPTAEVARLMRAAGPKVCVFPINGTRRWFVLEYALQPGEDPWVAYLDIAGRHHVELYRLLFDHGLDTLLTPVFGPDLLSRGEMYVEAAAVGMARMATHPDFTNFYQEYGVRVRFYGDYHQFFASTPYAFLSDLFDEITQRTMTHDRYRLFIGVCANDATETIARLSVSYHAEHGHAPDRRTLVELYYGEYVPPVNLFIGFEKFAMFDMPLVGTGNEDLYFTASPSPYLTTQGLRTILYDHLYLRSAEEPDYATMPAEDRSLMRDFYHANREKALGVGTLRGGVWYPLPQVTIPDGFPED